ncbi:MAG TPA: Rid family hydrolase [Thermoguttaceae bacterium]|nr:Rid family hydrolase [Thermoguttaceae bacterium]
MTDHHKQDQPGVRRVFLGGALAAATGGSLAAFSSASAQPRTERKSKAKRTGLTPEGLPPADSGYTQGILAEGQRLVFVSGQGPDDLTADVETQLRQTLKNIGDVLQVAGASFADVVFIRGYFVHLSRDLPVYRKIRKDYLKKPYPASSCVGVTELAVQGMEFEIEALAILP